MFDNAHTNKNVNDSYIVKLVQKLVDSGSVCNKKDEPQQQIRNEAEEMAVLEHVALDPSKSMRQIVEASGVSRSFQIRITKLNQ